jgi:chemotaxis protein methyltransferase CheR
LAILANERFTKAQLNRLEIVANDLNLKAISKARQGIYTEWSFREADENFKKRYFKRVNNQHYQLNDNIKEMVRFEHLSIQEYMKTLPQNGLDAILFRNVGVYIDKIVIQDLYESFALVLKRDGCLLVSPTDPQPPKDLFQVSSEDDVTIYKPTEGKSRGLCSLLAMHAASETTEKPNASIRRVSSIPPRMLPHIDSVRNLADRGDYKSALDECSKLIHLEPKSSEAHRLRGELLLHHSEASQAVLDFKRAVSLTPDDPITRYWYALGLEAAGDVPKALQEVKELIERLGSQPENAILSDGETKVAELVYAATSIERNLS